MPFWGQITGVNVQGTTMRISAQDGQGRNYCGTVTVDDLVPTFHSLSIKDQQNTLLQYSRGIDIQKGEAEERMANGRGAVLQFSQRPDGSVRATFNSGMDKEGLEEALSKDEQSKNPKTASVRR